MEGEAARAAFREFAGTSQQLLQQLAMWLDASKRAQVQDGPLQLVDTLIEQAGRLKEAAQALEEHQAAQRRLQQLRDEIAVEDGVIRSVTDGMKQAEAALEQVIDTAKRKWQQIETANEAAVAEEDVLRFAHGISSSFGTAAPTGWTAENPCRPFPQEFEMAGSALMKLTGETAVQVATGSFTGAA